MRTTGRRLLLLLAVAAVLVSCTGVSTKVSDGSLTVASGDAAPPSTTDLPDATPPTSGPAVATAMPAPTTSPTTTTTAPPPPPPPAVRQVFEPGWAPFAVVDSITLLHPAARVERIGFHESNHEGARILQAAPTAASPVRLEARDRGTAVDTAADVVVDPATEIRAPVTGRVKRAGTYVLYCKHRDDYLVIAPDARPEWEVKLLHIDGVLVRAGDRVVAGETVVAPRATQLPFESQVDELRTAEPAWPHVHLEVVDPSIRNVPSPNSGCN